MKKLVFIMPLMAISLLASCGGSKPEPPVVYHTITFHSNEGSEVKPLHVVDGELATEPKDPTKDTFVFAGWYTEDTLNTYFDFSKTTITQDYDLYARWEANYEYSVTLDCDNKLTLETDKGFLNQKDYTSKITLNSDQIGKYDIPEARGYYQVTVNGRAITNFTIEKVEIGVNTYYVNITIPKEQLGDNIVITTTPYTHYVSFTAVDAGVEIYYRANGSTPTETPKLKFCTDISVATPDWQDWEIGEDNAIKLENVGDTIYVWNTIDVFYTGKWFCFGTKNDNLKFSADGNVMSLINFGNLYDFCFCDMFDDCKSLISSPKLPATTLADFCYTNMFRGCLALVESPELPATTLANDCYKCMFYGCSALVNAPELPATTLANDCYNGMFYGCSALVNAPELPATTLASYCYLDMFGFCPLVNAPELPATTLANDCYNGMFKYCSELKINNTGAGTKFFTCPDTTPTDCVTDMFLETGGDFKGTPVANASYYYE